MTDVIQEWVTYQPPKSVSFGHQSTPRDPRNAWSQLQQFLAAVSELEIGHLTTLICCFASEQTDSCVAECRIEAARKLFGPERDVPKVFPYWELSEAQLATAIDFALDDDQFPKQELGPVNLHFYYRFLWPDFERLPYWPTQGDTRKRQSIIGVTMGSNRLFLQPHFVFPAPWHSAVLQDFLRQIEKTVPFRFGDQYFKRWIPKVAKGAYHGKLLKLPKDWREPQRVPIGK
jgi:hypothetical protein